MPAPACLVEEIARDMYDPTTDDMISAVRRGDHAALQFLDESFHEQVNELVDGESPMSVAAKVG